MVSSLSSFICSRLSKFSVSELGFSEILSFNSFPTVDLYLEFLIENWLGVNIHPSIDSASSLILGIDYTEP
ncbi:hypothetical protein NH340_JMT07569 [Sarcoptes scabiei]|nr:hypothetical protein NH340_JMT07569 [Sarcoptes scabiei]